MAFSFGPPSRDSRAAAIAERFAIDPPLTRIPPPAFVGNPTSSLSQSITLISICPAADAAIQCPANRLCPLISKSPMTLTKFVGLGTNA